MPGWVFAVLAGVTFGFSQLSNRAVNREIDAYRATTAMVTALFIFLIPATAITGQLSALPDLTADAAFWFVAAGLVHFLGGWTSFAFSQQKIGPSRTASLLSVNPVMAAIIAWLLLSETLRPLTWIGVITVTVGVTIITTGRLQGGKLTNPTLGLLATLAFSISPIFIRWGLDDYDYPLLGLMIGMAVTVPAMHLSTRLTTKDWIRVPRSSWRWLTFGGFMACVALTSQWTAIALIPVGTAISLQQLSTPVVLFVGPILLSAPAERATPRLLTGTALVIGGSVLVALFGRTLT